jgi:RNA-directed DNA polymerase
MEAWSLHSLFLLTQKSLSTDKSINVLEYARNLRKKNLPVIFNIKHLSLITKIEKQFIYSSILRQRQENDYKIFTIRKRDGKYRTIHAPNEKLKSIQSYINREILSKISPHHSCFSYHPNGGIKKCALQHTEAKLLFKYDLEDFFFHINEISIYKFFLELGYTSEISFQFARLCTTTRIREFGKYIKTYKKQEIGVLPQGAPTSPALSNFLAKGLDEELTLFAESMNMIYTRYSDDITFSSSVFFSREEIKKINSHIFSIVRKHRFRINKNKTSVSRSGARKSVLGILVHDTHLRIHKFHRKKIDTFLYSIDKFGWDSAANYYNFASPYGLANHLSGLITYINHIDENLGEKYRNKYQDLIGKLKYAFFD